jgi:UDP-N-acetylmuramate--alanine ligase
MGRELVGIAGTHGKTTTTVMTTTALAAAGREPTGIVGARVAQWEGNLRLGGDALYVVEADEYDRSFLALTPTVAVVTNMEADHLDIYKDLDDIRGAFAEFARGARTIVVCGEDAGATSMPTPNTAEVIRYGIDSGNARLKAVNVRSKGLGTAFDVHYDGEGLGAVDLMVPGRHNVLNALAAIASGLALGADFAAMSSGLASFVGAERRFQWLGETNGIAVVDDYAHHPTEIAATLAAAREAFKGRRIIAAFQPHLYTRTRDFSGDFGAALSAADAVYLTEIYPAREQPIAGVDAGLIERAMEKGKLAWRGERNTLAEALSQDARKGDVVITIGAGDITKTGPELLKRLA